jgi:hypothetical protein
LATLILFFVLLTWLSIGLNAARWAVTFALVWNHPHRLADVRMDWMDAVAVISAVFLIAKALA